jgi:hypothetical protein
MHRRDELGQVYTGLQVKFLEGYGKPTVRIEQDGMATLWQAVVKETYGDASYWVWEQL